MNRKNIYLVSVSLLLLLYAVVCLFAIPFADDYCFGWTASENISLWQKFLNQYLYWNGRYTSDLLVQFHPLKTGSSNVYALSLFLGIIALPLSLYFLFQQLIIQRRLSAVAALTLTSFYFTYLPDLTEQLYWFIGSANYHWAHVIILLHLGFTLKAIARPDSLNRAYQIIAELLLIIGIGFNEIAGVLLLGLYIALLLWSFKTKQTNTKFFLTLFLVALVCIGFVVGSPGNAIRSENFSDKHQLLYSVGYSFLQIFRFTGLWALSLPFLAFSIILLLWSNKIQWKINLPYSYWLWGVAALLIVFTGSFIPYYATGLLGQHRTINFVFLFYLLAYSLLLLSLSKKFTLPEKYKRHTNNNKLFTLMLISIMSMFYSGNTKKIVNDLTSGRFTKYKAAFYQRQNLIIQNKEAAIQPLNHIPETFQITDTKGDKDYWTEKCMHNFYSTTNIELK